MTDEQQQHQQDVQAAAASQNGSAPEVTPATATASSWPDEDIESELRGRITTLEETVHKLRGAILDVLVLIAAALLAFAYAWKSRR